MKSIILFVSLLIPSICFGTYPNNQVIQIYPQQVIQRHSVVFDADTYLGIPGYLGTVDKLKLQQIQQSNLDKETVKNLVGIIERLEQKLNGVAEQPVTQPQKEEIKQTDINTQVFSIFNKNCKNCHVKDNKLKLITENNGLYDLSAIQRWNVFYRTQGSHLINNDKKMPIGGNLSEKDISILEKWAIEKMTQELK